MTFLTDRRRLMLTLAAAAALPDPAAAQTASDASLRALEARVQGWLGVPIEGSVPPAGAMPPLVRDGESGPCR